MRVVDASFLSRFKGVSRALELAIYARSECMKLSMGERVRRWDWDLVWITEAADWFLSGTGSPFLLELRKHLSCEGEWGYSEKANGGAWRLVVVVSSTALS